MKISNMDIPCVRGEEPQTIRYIATGEKATQVRSQNCSQRSLSSITQALHPVHISVHRPSRWSNQCNQWAPSKRKLRNSLHTNFDSPSDYCITCICKLIPYNTQSGLALVILTSVFQKADELWITQLSWKFFLNPDARAKHPLIIFFSSSYTGHIQLSHFTVKSD